MAKKEVQPVQKDEVRARLSIDGFAEMSATERKGFNEWLKRVTKELVNEKDPKIFAKKCRFTLYKPKKRVRN